MKESMPPRPRACESRGVGTTVPFDEILTIVEVARELRCSKAHVYNAINNKVDGVSRLPAIHMGRRKLVRRSSLELWKRENEMGDAGGMLGQSSEVNAVGA